MSEQTYEIAGDIPAWSPFDRLVKARTHAGLNQDQMADRLGMSRRTVGAYEAGTREPKRPILIAWAMATGVNLRWLETGESPAPTPPGAPSRTRTYDLRIKSP